VDQRPCLRRVVLVQFSIAAEQILREQQITAMNVKGKENMGGACAASRSADLSRKRERLQAIIQRESVLHDREFRLTSGRSSNFFIDLKKTMFDPEGASLVADLLLDQIKDEDVDYIGGMEAGGIPIVATLSMRSWPEKPIRGFFVRKAAKGHGTDQRIDGFLEQGSKVILFEDVTTTGGSAMQVVDQCRQFGCRILKVISVVDRLEGADETFRAAGIEFEALFTRRDFS
jgi:orotate phosphoribosyltransferase